MLYIESALGNVFAVDGATGVTKWVYRQTRGAVTRRGVAVGRGYVYTHGGGSWIIALDHKTGAVAWERQVTGYGNMEKVAVGNTVVIGRTYDPATGQVGTVESTAVNAMAPTHLRVPVGTTVTFTNPADNSNVRGATQFFEGLFDVRLHPGESFRYTFGRRGEYFFNDPFAARPTGKVEASTEARPGSAARPGSPAGRTAAPRSGPRGSGWGSPARTGSRPVTPRGSRAR